MDETPERAARERVEALDASVAGADHVVVGAAVHSVRAVPRDQLATVVEAAGATTDDASLDGDSLLGLMKGTKTEWKNEAFSEYLAHGVARPMAMLRRGRYKLNYSLGDPPELYDMEADPNEFFDLALDPTYQEVARELQERLLARWNPEQLEQQVLRSQRERLLIERAHRTP